MSHSVNMGLEKLIETGLPVSVSVMFPCPWYQETVEILKRHPAVAVGIHLTLKLDALTSQRFREALKARNIQLMTYRQLIEMQGLKVMKRPGG